MREHDPQRPAALDTSFWAATTLAEAPGYVLRLFEVHCPSAVQEEITNERPPELRPDAALFRELVRHGAVRITDPRIVTVSVFGRGERATLSLAAERNWIALVNEWRAAAYGRTALRLTVMDVPQLILTVCAAGHVQKVKAHQMLGRIASITAPAVMHEAARVLSELP